jgi:hypothetical protein
MLFSERIAFYCENHAVHRNTLRVISSFRRDVVEIYAVRGVEW